MAKKVNQLHVLVASPGDVVSEREAAARIVDEVNRLIEKQGTQLRAKLWEYDAISQIGKRTQAIVNEQFGDACDIFVGIMWARIGTPTGEAESGTVEEYRRAKKRLDSDPRSVRIMFFFCDGPLDQRTLDIEQFAAVKRFRAEVESEGLVSSYSSLEEFELKLRAAIHKHSIEWGESWGNTPEEGTSGQTNLADETLTDPTALIAYPSEEIGFLDAIEEATEAAEIAVQALERIVDAIDDLGANITDRSQELNKLALHKPIDNNKVKRIANLAADDLDTFSARMAADHPIHRKSFSKYLERMSDAVLLSQDFTMDEPRRDELIAIRTNLTALDEQMETTIENTVGMQKSIVDTPRMTTRFNGARRQAQHILGEFIDAARENQFLAKTIREQIDGILDG